MKFISATLFLMSLAIETSANTKRAPRKALRGSHNRPLINADYKYLGDERDLQSSKKPTSDSTSSASTLADKTPSKSVSESRSSPSGSASSPKGSPSSPSSSSKISPSGSVSSPKGSPSSPSSSPKDSPSSSGSSPKGSPSGSESSPKSSPGNSGSKSEPKNSSKTSCKSRSSSKGSKSSESLSPKTSSSKSRSNSNCVAASDMITTKMNTAVILPDLVANDNVAEGQTLTVTSFSVPTEGGVLTTLDDGQTVFTPKTDFIGEDSFEYVVVDNLGETHIGVVFVSVDPIIEPPRANDDRFTLPENSEIKIDAFSILENDFAPEGNFLTLESCTDPSFGTIKMKAGKSVTYTPQTGFFGTDMITCTIADDKGGFDTSTITFTVNALDTDPFARDDIFVTNMGVTFTSPTPGIFANDRGVEQGTMTIVDCATPDRGTFTFDSSGAIQYVPEPLFLGVVTIECSLDNGRGGLDTSRILIAVRPPFFGTGLSTDEDVPLTIVSTDITTLGVVNSCNDPTFGQIQSNGDSTFTFTPKPNFNGEDTFECSVTDPSGAISSVMSQVNVRAVGDVPIAFPDNISTTMGNSVTFNPLANDIDPDGDELTIFFVTDPNEGFVTTNVDQQTLTYTPNDDTFIGRDSFEYTVNDGNGGISSTTVTVIVNTPVGGINTPPIARDDSYTGFMDIPLSISVSSGLLANDSDEDEDILIVSTFIPPSVGSIALSRDGSFIYFPELGFKGTLTFQYVLFDGSDTSSATVTIVIEEGTSGPVTAIGDSYTTTQATVLTQNAPGFLSNDFNFASVDVISGPRNGGLSWEQDGSFVYAPNAPFVGTDSFTYIIFDSNGVSSTATVTIGVTVLGLPNLITPGTNLIDLSGGEAASRVSSDCRGKEGAEFADCTGVNTVEEEENDSEFDIVAVPGK